MALVEIFCHDTSTTVAFFSLQKVVLLHEYFSVHLDHKGIIKGTSEDVVGDCHTNFQDSQLVLSLMLFLQI